MELKNAREQWVQSEKASREKWKEKKEAEIRETTIKGLEPEIERMLSRTRDDKRKIEEEFEDKLRIEKDRVEREADSRISSLKQKLILENENLLSREREFMQNRFQDQELKLKSGFEEEIARLNKRREEDVKRMESLFLKEKKYMESKIDELKSEKNDLEHRIKQDSNSEY